MKQFLNSLSLGFFIALRQVKRTNRWTTALIVFIMMLTFLNLVATSGFLVGIVEGSSRSFREQWTGDLLITNLNEKEYIEKTADIMGALSSFPQIESYSGRLVRSGTVEANWWEKRREEDTNRVGAQIAGINPEKEDKTTHLSQYVIKGRWLTREDARGVVIGSNLLQEYSPVADLVSLLKNVEPGVMVRLSVGSTTQDFTVAGIIDSKVDFVANRAYILDGELRKILGKSDVDVTEISIVMKNGIDPYFVKTPLIENGFSKGAKINTADEGAPEFLVNIKLFFSVIGTVLGSVSVVVALITIFIIIYINALTRRRQIGIMKGIGVSPFAIEFSYICQALFYVLIGSIIALVIIFAMLKPYLDANPIITPFADIVLVAEARDVLIKFLLVVFVSTLAGYVPAKLIVKKNTLNAILGRND